MARNRKRRSDRRPRRPVGEGDARPGLATANGKRVGDLDATPEALERPDALDPPGALDTPDTLEAPEALEHATPDVELAEAQLAIGRPALPADAAELEEAELEALDGDAPLDGDEPLDGGGAGSRGGSGRSGSGGGDGGGDGPGESLAPRPESAPAGRGFVGGRLIRFLQGSWRELQRVQWPDRRQVMQATGVVIGFVIVAGVFLGVADWAATKIVHFILD